MRGRANKGLSRTIACACLLLAPLLPPPSHADTSPGLDNTILQRQKLLQNTFRAHQSILSYPPIIKGCFNCPAKGEESSSTIEKCTHVTHCILCQLHKTYLQKANITGNKQSQSELKKLSFQKCGNQVGYKEK